MSRRRRRRASDGEGDQPVRNVLLNIWVVALIVLMIAGGGAGATGAVLGARASGLLGIEPALSIPAGIAGIAIGGMAGLGIALLIRFLPAMLREGTVARLILLCVLATALGGTLFMAVVGGLVWLAGLVLPDIPTRILATVLSIVATPVAGPIAFQLISGLPANFLPGGWRLPGWVYRVRRRRTAPEESRGPADLRGSASGKRD